MTKKQSKQSEAQVHLSKAGEKLESARVLLENGFSDDAASRAYYAVFHAVVAMLRARDVTLDIHKHAFVLTQFKLRFVDNNEFPLEMYFKIQQVKQVREQADYSAIVTIPKEKVMRLIADAKEIVGKIKDMLDKEFPREKPRGELDTTG
nr:HEPN domain-containing protein [Candidatus Sigynarchaeota archaeon]